MFSMNIPLSQVLEDEEVQRTICLMVQAELEQANGTIAEKNEQIQSVESENLFLKGRISQLEKENQELKGLQRPLENERGSSLEPGTSNQQPEETGNSGGQAETPEQSGHQQDNRKCGWICMCGSEFSSKEALNQHLKYFQTKRQFQCTQCPNRYAYATDLRKHLKQVHKVQPEPWMKFGCRQCGSFFRLTSELIQHYKTVHPVTKKPAIVTVQQEVAKESHGLAKRAKKSTSSKHLCHCGKEYKGMKNFQRHVKAMAKEVNAKK